jgi:hypothetical protein
MFVPCPSLPRAAVFGLFVVASSLHATTFSRAHDAPSGWAYPVSCCSGYDCREVQDAEIIEAPQGYVIKTTGEVIPMTDRKVKTSPDGQFHWCSIAGKADGKTICLFVPPRAY